MSAKELLAHAVDACHSLSKHEWRLHGISVLPVAQLDGETQLRRERLHARAEMIGR
jgi:hypothetical protein